MDPLNPLARTLEILQRYNAPPQAARLILLDMEEAGLFAVRSDPDAEHEANMLEAALDIVNTQLAATAALAADLAASKSPAIRGVAKRLKAVLGGGGE